LQEAAGVKGEEQTAAPATMAVAPTQQVSVPDLIPPEPLIEPLPLVSSSQASVPENPSVQPEAPESPPPPPSVNSVSAQAPSPSVTPGSPTAGVASQTRLQQQTAKLLHLQTKTEIELPQNLSIIHIGKPNDQIPPDIDVSGFPNSEVVSRVHADIRVEGDAYYIEDIGSSNGTYVNHTALPKGNRHRLRPGDRIALGKGDLVTFLFQIS